MNEGLVGELAYGGVDTADNLFCSLLGPWLLNVGSLKNECPIGSLPLTPFQSMDDFCDFLNSSPPIIQDCVTDAVATFTIPYVYRRIEAAKCCIGKCANKNNRNSNERRINSFNI